jgi:hypothetical protein
LNRTANTALAKGIFFIYANLALILLGQNKIYVTIYAYAEKEERSFWENMVVRL